MSYWVGPEIAVRAAANLADEYARTTVETRNGEPTSATRITQGWSAVWETIVPAVWAMTACPNIQTPVGVVVVNDQTYALTYQMQPQSEDP